MMFEMTPLEPPENTDSQWTVTLAVNMTGMETLAIAFRKWMKKDKNNPAYLATEEHLAKAHSHMVAALQSFVGEPPEDFYGQRTEVDEAKSVDAEDEGGTESVWTGESGQKPSDRTASS